MKTKRRLLRFSLRSLLIVLTVFCVWFGWYLHRVEQQRDAVQWVLDNGGSVSYDYQIDKKGEPVPKWLLDTLGVDYFATVTWVVFSFSEQVMSKAIPLDATPLAGLTNLEYLLIHSMKFSDVTPLAGLTNLVALDVGGTQVSDVTPLAGLTKLTWLDLRCTQVSAKDIEKIKQALPNCEIKWFPRGR